MSPMQDELGAKLSHVEDGLLAVLDELREISRGVHPAILTEGGLGAAVKSLARRSRVPVELDVEAVGRLPQAVEVAAYYVVSEALTNAAKHAGASHVQVELGIENGRVRMAIRDDGVGGADPTRGTGLLGLRDRVEALGGVIEVESSRGQGTALHVRLPVEQAALAPQ